MSDEQRRRAESFIAAARNALGSLADETLNLDFDERSILDDCRQHLSDFEYAISQKPRK